MTNPFNRIKVGVLNDHFDQLGGGTTHSFKLIEFLKEYYDVDVFLPENPKDKYWMKNMLNLDTENVRFMKYAKGIGKQYDYMFLNISHWKAEETNALKQYMLVFFPQFFFPTYDYKFIANSEYTKRHIIDRWNKKEDDISVIYPPIQTSQFKMGKKENIILHVSRLAKPRPEADKGHFQMIESFKKLELDDWEFHIVGQPQDPEYVADLKKEAQGHKIIFHESLPFNKLKDLYSLASIYWHMTGISMPNDAGAQEHFGMTIVEAMASGCVPVVYKSGGPIEIISEGVDGFLVDDCEQLVYKTKKLALNAKALKEMPELAQQRARCFDEIKVKKKFYSLLTKTDKVSIVMICHNNLEFTKKAVERLYEVTPPGFQLILINNASTDGTKEYIEEIYKKYDNVTYQHNNDNLGFGEANNIGLNLSDRDYVCYLNNDTLPQPGWLEHMIDVLETKEDAGVVGSRLYYPQGTDGVWRIQHAGKELQKDLKSKHIGRHKPDDHVPHRGIEEVELVTGACMLIRRELAEFDTRYERGYYEDDDLCLRVREAGWAVYINHDSKVIHYEGKTQDILKRKDSANFTKVSENNYKIFKETWKDRIDDIPPMEKHTITYREGNMIRGIEIGGGENPDYPEYEQVDLRKLPHITHVNDARVLPYPDESVKNIYSSYMLQCLSKAQAEVALREWYRVLVPGGRLEIHVPDIHQAIIKYVATHNENWMSEIYGKQQHELDYYRYGWTFKTMDELLSKIPFVRVSQHESPANKETALSVVAYKPQ